MTKINALRSLSNNAPFNENDVLVIFGEVFQRGYVNGIIEEAEKRKMKVIYSTVGRRDGDGELRPLNSEELKEKQHPLINIPLEAGFDMQKESSGISPVDQLKGVKLKEWDQAKLDWGKIEESKKLGVERFKTNVDLWVKELRAHIPEGANVVFAHTMAGGVPRTKIVMPLMNRVFKGHGDRYMSSEEFWTSEIGKFCEASFLEVTANTFDHLIQATQSLREDIEEQGQKVSYVAYGYHGTELLINGDYTWQSYSPYLQGFAKIELENIAKSHWQQGVKAMVFNAPEILTNSSSIFLGIEVALYPLLGALQREQEGSDYVKGLLQRSNDLLKDGHSIDNVLELTNSYFTSETIKNEWSHFEQWPQHNGPEQMRLMRETSQNILNMHKDEKNLLTQELSELVFKACGIAMLSSAYEPMAPVWWIGHDLVAKATKKV